MAQAAAPRTALVRRARRINRELARPYPDARNELTFTTPLELLVAAILSAQTTDRRVKKVTRMLFAQYRAAADYARADRAELKAVIRPTGYYRAERLRASSSRPGHFPDRSGGSAGTLADHAVCTRVTIGQRGLRHPPPTAPGRVNGRAPEQRQGVRCVAGPVEPDHR